jgi:hypothetical protein
MLLNYKTYSSEYYWLWALSTSELLTSLHLEAHVQTYNNQEITRYNRTNDDNDDSDDDYCNWDDGYNDTVVFVIMTMMIQRGLMLLGILLKSMIDM